MNIPIQRDALNAGGMTGLKLIAQNVKALARLVRKIKIDGLYIALKQLS
ncbi:MAG: hypothetical protein ACLQUW_03175 [Desulfobaccales bacterium]